jgi:hypothetical protein
MSRFTAPALLFAVAFLIASCGVSSEITNDAPAETTAEEAAPTGTEASIDAAPIATVPSFTPSQENAIRSAQQYLDYTAFSAQGLVDQLIYEQFSADDANFAVFMLGADWNEQAAKSAAQYLDYTAFSCGSLILRSRHHRPLLSDCVSSRLHRVTGGTELIGEVHAPSRHLRSASSLLCALRPPNPPAATRNP